MKVIRPIKYIYCRHTDEWTFHITFSIAEVVMSFVYGSCILKLIEAERRKYVSVN